MPNGFALGGIGKKQPRIGKLMLSSAGLFFFQLREVQQTLVKFHR
jgi:hypothetical protein